MSPLASLGLGVGVALTALSSQASAEPSPRAADAPVVEYWTIEPNEGQSAGGHSAIRIDDVVYHVEHRGDGLIQDRRDPRDVFERAYRGRENRAIEVLRLGLPDAVARELAARLRAREAARRVRLDRLESIDETLGWLDEAIATGQAHLAIPGLGLLVEADPGCSAGVPAARKRRDRVLRYAEEDLGARRAAARRRASRALAELVEADRAASDLGPLREAIQLEAALGAIERCREIDENHLAQLVESDRAERFVDQEDDSPHWGTLADRLERDLARLIASERPDRGLAILLAWGRLTAVDRTIEEGRVVLLDAFAERARDGSDSPRPPSLPPEWAAERRRAAAARVAQARSRLLAWTLADGPVEARFDRLERARHDLAHTIEGLPHRPVASPQAGRGSRARERPARAVVRGWPAGLTLDRLRALRARLGAAREALRSELEADLGYALFTRNCVTELLVALDAALATDPRTAAFARRRRKDPEATLAFIPVVAGRIVARAAPVDARMRLPSAREGALAARATTPGSAGEPSRPPLGHRIREANTLTSRAYRPHAADSSFLFFSARPIWLRPAAGLANWTVGFGTSLAGAFSAPFDRGETLARGLRGMLMSVPELFFFNVRKGSYVLTPPIAISGAPAGGRIDDPREEES